jgi:hypothetical protein
VSLLREVRESVVSDQDDLWARAWARGRQKSREAAPRRAAMWAAIEAVEPTKNQPEAQIRDALVRELAARGIEDVTKQQLDFLVEAVVTSPARAGVRHGLRGLKSLVGVLGEMKKLADPRWTYAPDDIPSVSELRDDQQELSVILDWDPATRDVIARLFAELPSRGHTPEGDREPRMCDCWLSVESDGGPSAAVIVHVGKFAIAELSGDPANTARNLIAVHGGRRHAVSTFAEVYGDDPDTGSIKIFLPDRA